jgi:CheY-like chemotaxis protein
VDEVIEPGGRRLVLLVDNDVGARRQARHLLELRGMEVVQAANGIAALELIQRLPRSFRLVLTDLELPGIPGSVIVETLRIFRPDIPVLCMSSARAVPGAAETRRCLSKPLDGTELEAALDEGAGAWAAPEPMRIAESVATRARARFAMGGDLVEAALELVRGMNADE